MSMTLIYFNFIQDDGTDLLDVLPESQKKLLELQQILLVYEALISYTIFSWDKSSDSGLQVLHLFKAYTRFMEFGKVNISIILVEK